MSNKAAIILAISILLSTIIYVAFPRYEKASVPGLIGSYDRWTGKYVQ